MNYTGVKCKSAHIDAFMIQFKIHFRIVHLQNNYLSQQTEFTTNASFCKPTNTLRSDFSLSIFYESHIQSNSFANERWSRISKVEFFAGICFTSSLLMSFFGVYQFQYHLIWTWRKKCNSRMKALSTCCSLKWNETLNESTREKIQFFHDSWHCNSIC